MPKGLCCQIFHRCDNRATIIISYFEFEKLCKKYINAEERQKVIEDSLFSNSKSTDYCPKHFLMRGVIRISEHYGYDGFRKCKTSRISRRNDNFSNAIFTAFYLFSIMVDPTRFDRLNIEIDDRILARLRIYFVEHSVPITLNILETIKMTEDSLAMLRASKISKRSIRATSKLSL